MQGNLEHLGEIKRHTGRSLPLRAWEEIEKLVITDTQVTVLVETFRYREMARDINFTERHLKMVSFILTENGWVDGPVFSVQDETFIPFTHVKFGRSVSPREYADKKRWEKMTYRVGNAQDPMDNYEVTSGGGSTLKMRKHWGMK